MNNTFGVISLFCLILLGYFFVKGSSPKGPTLMEIQTTPRPGQDIRYCEEDSECIPIAEQCCDCKEGGNRIAINRAFYKYELEQKSDACMLSSCSSARSTSPSCDGAQAKCVNNQCQMK